MWHEMDRNEPLFDLLLKYSKYINQKIQNKNITVDEGFRKSVNELLSDKTEFEAEFAEWVAKIANVQSRISVEGRMSFGRHGYLSFPENPSLAMEFDEQNKERRIRKYNKQLFEIYDDLREYVGDFVKIYETNISDAYEYVRMMETSLEIDSKTVKPRIIKSRIFRNEVNSKNLEMSNKGNTVIPLFELFLKYSSLNQKIRDKNNTMDEGFREFIDVILRKRAECQANCAIIFADMAIFKSWTSVEGILSFGRYGQIAFPENGSVVMQFDKSIGETKLKRCSKRLFKQYDALMREVNKYVGKYETNLSDLSKFVDMHTSPPKIEKNGLSTVEPRVVKSRIFRNQLQGTVGSKIVSMAKLFSTTENTSKFHNKVSSNDEMKNDLSKPAKLDWKSFVVDENVPCY